MKKLLAGALGALTLMGASAVSVGEAQARPHGRYYDHGYYSGHRHRGNGDAVAAGIAGLALGAIIGSAAASNRAYAPPPAYYGPPPAYYSGPRICRVQDWVWDPYWGRRVLVERDVRC